MKGAGVRMEGADRKGVDDERDGFMNGSIGEFINGFKKRLIIERRTVTRTDDERTNADIKT